jgi:hypothetical protein
MRQRRTMAAAGVLVLFGVFIAFSLWSGRLAVVRGCA